MLLLLVALAAPTQDDVCTAPCRHTTCHQMSALGMTCGHLESLGCRCGGCCVETPACNNTCLASTCGALRHTLSCEEIEGLNAGCECGGCCNSNPSRPPPSPALPPPSPATPSTASSMARLGEMVSHTATDRIAAGDFSGLVLVVLMAPVLRSDLLTKLGDTAFTLLAKVPGLKAEAPRYVIFYAAQVAILYFLLQKATTVNHGPWHDVAIMLAFACPVAVLVCAVTACSRGAPELDEAEQGVTVRDVCADNEECWEEACDKSGLAFWPAAFVAGGKLVLWHWLQPAAYLVALAVYWSEIGTASRWLGAIVGVREAIYVALTLAGLFVKPAYLLVGVDATLKDVHDHHAKLSVLMFVFAPEKFVFVALNPGSHIGRMTFLFLLVLIALDLVAIAALVVAILPEEPFPPPLLVGYALTALGGVTMILVFIYT